MKKIGTLLSLVTVMALNIEASSLEERLNALEERNELLTEEILNAKSGGFTKVQTGQSHSGLGEAASKVYYSESPLSIGGYGEMYVAKKKDANAFSDVYRFIPYFGYKFSDSVIMNTELEIEHGGSEVAIEFMYLDFLLYPSYNVRVGNLLVPMGITNLRHEPTLFNTVQRPDIEKYLVPSTWHENGVMAYGDVGDISYSAGIINTLNLNSKYATDISEPKRGQWIRKGRQGSNEKAPFKPAFVGRLDYKGMNGLIFGVSDYIGSGSNLVREKDIKGTTMNIFDIHATYEQGGLIVKGLYTRSDLSSAEKFGDDTITVASGYYLNVAYDISSVVGIDMKLPLFAQYESYNPVEERVSGQGELDSINNITLGVNLYPTDQVVLKADIVLQDDKNQEDTTQIASLSFGFIF